MSTAEVKSIAGGVNGQTIKKGIDKAATAIVKALEASSTPVTDETLVNVASISANDPEIGKEVADAMIKVGKNGSLTVEETHAIGIKTEIVDGLRFDRGYVTPYFAFNQESGVAILNNPAIFLTEKGIMDQETMLSAVEKAMENGKRDLLVIAETVEGEALNMLVAGHLQGKIKVCAVKAPGFANHKKELLLDIAAITGSVLVSDATGKNMDNLELADFGSASKIIITKDTTTIVGGGGSKEAIEARINVLKSEKEASESEFDKTRYEERIAKLSGGVGIIKVGANSEIEAKEKKHRIEDAIRATSAAREAGIVAGGGIALIRAAQNADYSDIKGDEILGANILIKAIESPLFCIATNAGQEGGYIVKKAQEFKDNVGYDAMNNRFVDDMVVAGIIDPTKVTKLALENAVSAAGGILSAGAVITNINEIKAP